MTTPIWQHLPTSNRDECEVIVIGAGIAGVSLALHLQRSGRRVIVIERHEIASGASGRNAGFLMRGAADNYAACARDMGRERARDLWTMTEANLRGLLDEGAGELPSCSSTLSCLLALDDREAVELRASFDLLCNDGFDAELRTTGSDAIWRVAKPIVGLVNPNDRTINPVELVRHLASKLERPPIEHAQVDAIDSALSSGITVCAGGLEIRAEQVALCTNAYTRLIAPDLSPTIEPNRAQMLAIRVEERLLDFAYYANHGGEYLRQVDDKTIAVGGMRRRFLEKEKTDVDATTPKLQSALEAFANQMLGIREPHVIARWSGIMGFTPDHLPLAGPIDDSGRIWVCAGFNGHGMSLAHETARRTAQAMLGSGEAPFPPGRIQRTPVDSPT